jgi:hypothetical protein
MGGGCSLNLFQDAIFSFGCFEWIKALNFSVDTLISIPPSLTRWIAVPPKNNRFILRVTMNLINTWPVSCHSGFTFLLHNPLLSDDSWSVFLALWAEGCYLTRNVNWFSHYDSNSFSEFCCAWIIWTMSTHVKWTHSSNTKYLINMDYEWNGAYCKGILSKPYSTDFKLVGKRPQWENNV